MKITRLELENVKRVKAVAFSPLQDGATIIGGDNGQGKTSVLDAIAWALGGERFRPSNAQNEQSVLPPSLYVELSNGIVVERKGVNSALKVTDKNGNKSGQALLDEFVENLALDLPKFMQKSDNEKANTLLQIIGLKEEVEKLEKEEKAMYNHRFEVGRVRDQKAKYAKEMLYYSEVPEEELSVLDLIRAQQDLLLRNAENAKKRNMVERLQVDQKQVEYQLMDVTEKIQALMETQKDLQRKYEKNAQDLVIAQTDALTLQDESTEALEDSIRDVESTNKKIRQNKAKKKAEEEAEGLKSEYDNLTEQIKDKRAERLSLLQHADLPLEGLTVEDGRLLFKNKAWDCMSSSEQLKVAVSIVRKLNDKCEFVLIDKMEQMDKETLKDFSDWLKVENLQAICTRVSDGKECELIIEDGRIKEAQNAIDVQNVQAEKKWGTF